MNSLIFPQTLYAYISNTNVVEQWLQAMLARISLLKIIQLHTIWYFGWYSCSMNITRHCTLCSLFYSTPKRDYRHINIASRQHHNSDSSVGSSTAYTSYSRTYQLGMQLNMEFNHTKDKKLVDSETSQSYYWHWIKTCGVDISYSPLSNAQT